ncbi:hypothetical protein [Chitinophaga rhizophila]|uniref:Uncharacterized protein n=1 Tax=Chitinophaga rhizophila TaxID=2866212 RepID=A0ABS7GCW3_9BACT|nr:hypothetical protein [Chitinophaga rhizophila]MBW8684644.1 hypothetical protein [Chitinophaga rhizophila]
MLHLKIHSTVRNVRKFPAFVMLFIFVATLAIQVVHRHAGCHDHVEYELNISAAKSCLICDYTLHQQVADGPERPFVLVAPVTQPVTLAYGYLLYPCDSPLHIHSSRGPPSFYC